MYMLGGTILSLEGNDGFMATSVLGGGRRG
jgi:hypothetical protein